MLTKLLISIILPPFNSLILCFFSLFFSRLHFKKCAHFCSILAIFSLYIFSIPYTVTKLHDSLLINQNYSLEEYKQAQAIVVLGGGLRHSNELSAPNSLSIPPIPLERLRYAAYLHKQTQLPILLTGSDINGNSEAKVMQNELNEFFNTPVTWLEEQATNTSLNAYFSKKLLEKENINTIILVTNEWHMQRAKLTFEKQGFNVLPANVGSGPTPSYYKLDLMYFIPQAISLNTNTQLLKEWIGYWKEKLSD